MPRRARERPGLVKMAMPSELWGPLGRDRETKLRTQKGEQDARIQKGYWRLRIRER